MLESHLHEAQVGVFRGEGIVGDFGRGFGEPAEQSGFARVGQADESHVRNQFEFEDHVAFFAGFAGFGFAGGLVGGGGEAFVALAAFAALGDDDGFPAFGQILEQMPAVGIADQSARRHADDGIFPAAAGSEIAFAVPAPLGFPMFMAHDVREAADVFIRDHNHAAAPSAVAAVGTAARHVGFPAKAHAAVAAVTRFTIYRHAIYKHGSVEG